MALSLHLSLGWSRRICHGRSRRHLRSERFRFGLRHCCRREVARVAALPPALWCILDLGMGVALGSKLETFLRESTRGESTLYACLNQVVPFFLLLTSAIHSLQLPQRPSHTSGFPSMRLVSWGSWKGLPVAALIPWVKLLSYQKAEFLSTSHRPGLQIPHQPSRLLPCPRTHLGVYKSPSNLSSCS